MQYVRVQTVGLEPSVLALSAAWRGHGLLVFLGVACVWHTHPVPEAVRRGWLEEY